MSVMASQITSVMIVYSTVCSGADQRKYQISMSLALMRGIHRWPVNSSHKGLVTQKMFPFDDVIMKFCHPWESTASVDGQGISRCNVDKHLIWICSGDTLQEHCRPHLFFIGSIFILIVASFIYHWCTFLLTEEAPMLWILDKDLFIFRCHGHTGWEVIICYLTCLCSSEYEIKYLCAVLYVKLLPV